MLLSDQQIMALPLYHRVIADQDLVSFHAVANGHETAARPRPVFDTNVANFERVVRAHIDARATANADTIALPVSPTPVTQSASNTCPIVNADAEALPTQDVPTTDQAPDAARMAGTNTLALPAPGSYAASFTARPVGPTAVPPHATTSTMRVARAATTRLVSQASARLAVCCIVSMQPRVAADTLLGRCHRCCLQRHARDLCSRRFCRRSILSSHLQYLY